VKIINLFIINSRYYGNHHPKLHVFKESKSVILRGDKFKKLISYCDKEDIDDTGMCFLQEKSKNEFEFLKENEKICKNCLKKWNKEATNDY